MNHPLWQLAGWTIVHFAWLGAAALLVLAAVRWLTGRLPANMRYALSLISLLTIAALPIAIASYLTATLPSPAPAVVMTESQPIAVIPLAAAPTFTSELPPDPIASSTPTFVTVEAAPTFSPATPAVDVPSDVARITDFVAASARYLPWLWVVGSPVMLVWLLGGLSATRRLRTTARPIDDSALIALVARLRERLRVSQRVAVMLSERVRTPVLVGIIKPLVLLPPAALTGWSSEELEFALLHELAHVRRCDNLVNLLQRAIEALLWFHPAVWITSHWVRVDREHCCDALVVRHTGRPHDYARLLVDVASGTRYESSPALASAMARHPLASRVRRILNLPEEPMRVSRSGLAALMLGLLSVTSAWLWWPEGTRADNLVPTSAAAGSAVPAAETLPPSMPLDPTNPLALPPVTATLQVDDSAPATGTPLTDSPLDLSRPFSQLPFTGSIPQLASQPMTERVVATFDDDAPFEQVAAVVKEHSRPNVSVSIQRQPDGRTLIIAKEIVIGAITPQPTITPPAPAADPDAFQFPTLEEQRQRDTAYALLRCEVEPLTDEQLTVCREHKFSGGVRVAHALRNQGTAPSAAFIDGDIIVGLHVWPTRSIAELAQVLVRPDMPGGTPIKFYALRRVGAGELAADPFGEEAGEGASDENRYELVSYRLTLDAEQQRELRMSQMRQPLTIPTTVANMGELLGADPMTLPPSATRDNAASASEPATLSTNEAPNSRYVIEVFLSATAGPSEAVRQQLPRLRSQFQGIDFQVVNADLPERKAELKRKLIDRVPTLVIYVDGKEVQRTTRIDEISIRQIIEQAGFDLTPMPATPPAAASPLPWTQPPPAEATDPANNDRWNSAPPAPQPTELPSSPAIPLGTPIPGTALNTSVPAEPGQPQTVLWVFHEDNQSMPALLEALRKVQSKHRQIPFIQIDVKQHTSMAGALGVHTTPTLLLCQGSDVKGRLEGAATTQQIEELIEPPLPAGLAVYQVWRDEKELEFNKPALEALRERYNRLSIMYFPIGAQANPHNQVIADKLGVDETPVVVVANGGKVLATFTDEVTVEQLDAALPAEKENLRTPPQPLLYEGLTFEQWSTAWRVELAPSRAVDAVNAFAAFARAGKQQEAAAEILDMASRYNWNLDATEWDVVNPIRQSVFDAFRKGSSPAVPGVVWLTLLEERLDADFEKYRWIAITLTGFAPGTKLTDVEQELADEIQAKLTPASDPTPQ